MSTGGSPFKWTVTFNGLNYRTVTAEAALSKVALSNQGGHAKATVWAATVFNPSYPSTPSSYNWGINGPPIVTLSGALYLTYALEVSGPGTFAHMTCKMFFH